MRPLLVLAALLLAAPASAQTVCGKRDDVLKKLLESYDETPHQWGLANNGGVVELMMSPGGKTWTIVITLPGGPMCFVGSGDGWMPVKQKGKGA